MYRTDKHHNPAAVTTDIARQAGLVEGIDFERGDPFSDGSRTLYTAKFLKDPIETTIRIIDAIGYYTHTGSPRWSYIALPKFIWDSLTPGLKARVVGFHYSREGGTEMKDLFPNT